MLRKMDHQNLHQEQKDVLNEALALIDGILDQVGHLDFVINSVESTNLTASQTEYTMALAKIGFLAIIGKLGVARNKVNSVVTGELTELRPSP
jgi:hypothetical protein